MDSSILILSDLPESCKEIPTFDDVLYRLQELWMLDELQDEKVNDLYYLGRGDHLYVFQGAPWRIMWLGREILCLESFYRMVQKNWRQEILNRLGRAVCSTNSGDCNDPEDDTEDVNTHPKLVSNDGSFHETHRLFERCGLSGSASLTERILVELFEMLLTGDPYVRLCRVSNDKIQYFA